MIIGERLEVDDTFDNAIELEIMINDGEDYAWLNLNQTKQLRDHLTKVIDEFENR